VKFIKAQRIRWLGHVKRMEEGAMARKVMEGRLFIGRRKGRPHLRWMDDVGADLKTMKIKQWMEKMQDREKWRLMFEEAKAQEGRNFFVHHTKCYGLKEVMFLSVING
jgi:hypothetical protein